MKHTPRRSFVSWDEAGMTAHHATGRSASLHGFHPQDELASRHFRPVLTPARLGSGRTEETQRAREENRPVNRARTMSLLKFGPGQRLGWISNLD